MTLTPERRWIRIPGLIACGFFGLSGQGLGSTAEAAGPRIEADTTASTRLHVAVGDVPVAETTVAEVEPREAVLRADARVRAFILAYDTLIDSVTYRDDDLVFTLGGRAIHFQEGRMLAEGRLDRRDRCDGIFYRYPLDLPTEPAAPSKGPVTLCTDLQEALWGRTEDEIREHARATAFLSRRMFLNDLVVQALRDVERDILTVASADPSVASWVDDIDITFSFIDRGIAGTSTRSQHAWGLAVDLVPESYDGRQVYWRWSRAWNPGGWHRIPLEERWSPPPGVVEIFERHGFLWGGKWAHFDNIHFEYRPEILEYNRLLEAEGA